MIPVWYFAERQGDFEHDMTPTPQWTLIIF